MKLTPSTSMVSIYVGLGSNLGDREFNLHTAAEQIGSLGLVLVRSSSIYETEPVGYQDQPWFLNQVVELALRPEVEVISDQGELAACGRTQSLRTSASSAAGESPEEIPRQKTKRYEDEDLPEKQGQIREDSSGLLLQAEALLCALLKIEAAMGRERQMPNGPRVIDTDLLFFGDLIVGFHSGDGQKPGYLIVPHPRMHLRRFVLEPLCEIAPDLVHPVFGKRCRELLAAVDDKSVVRRYA